VWAKPLPGAGSITAAAVAAMKLAALRSAYHVLFGQARALQHASAPPHLTPRPPQPSGSKNHGWLRQRLLAHLQSGAPTLPVRQPVPLALSSLATSLTQHPLRRRAPGCAGEAERPPKRSAPVPLRFVEGRLGGTAPLPFRSQKPGCGAPKGRRPPLVRTISPPPAPDPPRQPPRTALPFVALTGGDVLQPGESVFVLTPAGLKAERTCTGCRKVARPPELLLYCATCQRCSHAACGGPAPAPAAFVCGPCAAAARGAAPVREPLLARLAAGYVVLARVDALWWDPTQGGFTFTARWYHTPPVTAATRWHAGSRVGTEVCLGPPEDCDTAPVAAVLQRAAVVSPAGLRAAGLEGGQGPLLVCSRSYDPAAGAFVRLSEVGALAAQL